MVGSNNDVAVLEAVLASLVKSPAFSLLEESHTRKDEVAAVSAPVLAGVSY